MTINEILGWITVVLFFSPLGWLLLIVITYILFLITKISQEKS